VATGAVADDALAMLSSEARDENQLKMCITAAKQDFYSFKLCTVDKVHAVSPVDNDNDMLFPSEKFNSLNVWVDAKNEKRTHSAAPTETHPLVTRQS